MNTRYRDDIEDEQAAGEREITLNAATILGIFFLLAIICAVFFGFGYTLGRKSAPSSAAETLAAPAPAQVAVAPSAPKPAPGSRAFQPETPAANPAVQDSSESQAPPPGQIPQPAVNSAVTTPQQVTIPLAKTQSAPTRQPAAVPTAAPVAHSAAVAAAPVFMVQIAAVSHQEDAEVLRTALERRNYHITIVRVPQDKLLHVQIGPFTNRMDADAMRQRLLNDGYNAIVK